MGAQSHDLASKLLPLRGRHQEEAENRVRRLAANRAILAGAASPGPLDKVPLVPVPAGAGAEDAAPCEPFSDEDDADGIYIVKEIYKDTVLVDGNHPFAGKDLIFDVQVINIEEPSFTELETGFPDRDENFDEGSDYPDSYDDHYDGFDDPDNLGRRWR